MLSTLCRCCLAAAVLWTGVSVMPAGAQNQGMPADAREAFPQTARSDARSLSDTIRRVQRSTGGQILGAERVPFDGRNINRVKYMDDRGRVRYMDDPVPERSAPRAPRAPSNSQQVPPPQHGDNQ